MKREFQAAYRTNGGPVLTVDRIANTADEVRHELEQAGLNVVGVTEVRAVVDWNKPVWDLDEFAAAMSIKGGSLSGKKGDGKIPWSKDVGGVPRAVALEYINSTLNAAGKNIVAALKLKSA